LRFITEKSVEEAMHARAQYKLDIDEKVIQAGRFDNKSTEEEQAEFLVRLLLRG
jgi:ATP-dependent helicase STH1/SNF2